MLSRLSKQFVGDLPITRHERRAGAAIRFASSATYGEKLFYFDVRCLCSGEHAADIELIAKGERGKTAEVTRRSCVEIAPPQGAAANEPWFETQYIVKLPVGFGTLYLDCRRAAGRRTLARARAEENLWADRLIAEYYRRVRNPLVDESYGDWLVAHRATEGQLAQQRKASFEFEPLISLVTPVYRTPPAFLRTMVDSVLAQTYGSWELVIVNASPDDEGVTDVLASYGDARIRVIEHPENDGISGNTNCGIAACAGDYIGFIDHDDFIEPDLLYEYVKAINENDCPGLLYCDEDSFDEARGYTLALFKPDANLDLLYSNNYVVHLLMVSRNVIEHTVRSGLEMNGAQDYDLTLQAFHAGERVVHIAKPLYHWRIHEQSTNDGNTSAKPYTNRAGARALEVNFGRRNLDVHVEETDVPCDYKCVFASARSPEDAAVAIDALEDDAHIERNRRAREEDAEFVLFASANTRVDPGVDLNVLLGYFERGEIGVLAPRLVNPDGLLAQTGLVIRSDANVMFMGHDMPAEDAGYTFRFHRPCNYTAVSGDCCMIRRAEFLELGGYCEEFSTLLYASVDLCLRYRERGKLVAYTPFVTFEHAQRIVESVGEQTDEQIRALEHDKALLRERWPGVIGKADPLFNPNLDDSNPYFVLR